LCRPPFPPILQVFVPDVMACLPRWVFLAALSLLLVGAWPEAPFFENDGCLVTEEACLEL